MRFCTITALVLSLIPTSGLADNHDEISREMYDCGTTKWSWLAVSKVDRLENGRILESAFVLQHIQDRKFALAFPSFIERLFAGPVGYHIGDSFRFEYVGHLNEGMREGVVSLSLKKRERILNEGVNHGINAGDVEATLTGTGEAFQEVTARLAKIWEPVASFEFPDGAPTSTHFFCNKK